MAVIDSNILDYEEYSDMPPLEDYDDTYNHNMPQDSTYDEEEDYNILGEPAFHMINQERFGFTSDNPVIAIKHTFNGRQHKYYYEWDPNTETPENLLIIQDLIYLASEQLKSFTNMFETETDSEPSDLFNGGFIFISDGSKPENGGICIDRVWNTTKIESNPNVYPFVQIMDMISSKILELISTQEIEEFDEEELEDIPVRLSELDYNECIKVIPSSQINKTQNSCCTICQDKFEDSDKCHVIDCGHAYHEDCLKQWLCHSCQIPTCPNCRHDSRECSNKKKESVFNFNFDSNFDIKNISFGEEFIEGEMFIFGTEN